MFKNNVRIILRQIRSIYSFINLTGLTIGFTTFILIYLWVNEELSYDTFNDDYQNIFRIVKDTYNEKGEITPIAVSPGPLANYLKTTFPAVRQTCRVTPVNFCIRTAENCFYKQGLAVDTTFFDLFNFPLLEGSPSSFGNGTDKIIISRKLATTFFADENPIGRLFTIGPHELIVVALLENPPKNTHFPAFEYLIPIDFMKANGLLEMEDWNSYNLNTYVSINQTNTPPTEFESSIKESYKNHDPESTSLIKLQSLADIHLKSKHLSNDMKGHGDITYVYIFSVVALLVLVIASINYSNLATARSLKRSRETGVRKVLGSTRWQLISYFFSESVLYSIISLLGAFLISWILLPYFNELSGKEIEFDLLNISILLPISIAAIFCALLAGIYPAIILSTQNPTVALKGLVKSGKKTIVLRRVLVTIQFVLSISLLSATFIIQQQLQYISSKDLGYDSKNIITFTAVRKISREYAAFKNELLNLPEVKYVTASNNSISFTDETTGDVEWASKNTDQELLFNKLVVDYDYLKTHDIELSSGRDFSLNFASDSSAIIINEAALSKMNLQNPINQEIKLYGKKYNLIGIVKDFHFKSVHKIVEPLIIYIDPSAFYNVSVLLDKSSVIQGVAAVEGVFKKFVPNRPFDVTFVDDAVEELYLTEKSTSGIFKYLSGLSLFISCLGLLGIVMFVTEQRSKELAVRKVMGASTYKLMTMLLSEYTIMVLMAFCISLPLVYYVMQKWLDNFAYKIDMNIWPIVTSSIITLFITWVTVAYHNLKAAISNPIESLRSE